MKQLRIDTINIAIPLFVILFYSHSLKEMLRSGRRSLSYLSSKFCVTSFCRFEGNDLGWKTIQDFKETRWPVLTGCADAIHTKQIKSEYIKKRVTNIVPKYAFGVFFYVPRTGWEISALGYGRGGSRVKNDDWSGEIQRACRFGSNFVQVFSFGDGE